MTSKIDSNTSDDFPEPCMEATGGKVAGTTPGGDKVIEALKPCPFCGSEKWIITYQGQPAHTWNVTCGDCHARGPNVGTQSRTGGGPAEAMTISWNRRTPAETVSRDALTRDELFTVLGAGVMAHKPELREQDGRYELDFSQTIGPLATDLMRLLESKSLPAPQPVAVGEVDGIRLHSLMMEESKGYLHVVEWEELPEDVQIHLGSVAKRILADLASRPPVPAPVSVPGVVKRYDMEVFGGDAAMLEDEFGQYVLYDDIAHLLTRTVDLGAEAEVIDLALDYIDKMIPFRVEGGRYVTKAVVGDIREAIKGAKEALAALKAGRVR